MAKFRPMANMQTSEKSSLDIFEMFVGTNEPTKEEVFEMFARTNEPTKEEVNKELQMFTKFQVGVNNIKCFFRVVGKTRVLISNYGIFCSSHSWHCWFSNGN
jgi:hypothetical protein